MEFKVSKCYGGVNSFCITESEGRWTESRCQIVAHWSTFEWFGNFSTLKKLIAPK